jgi:hypothetical protein
VVPKQSQLGAQVAQVVGVHGVGQQHQGPNQLHHTWYPALADGLHLAGSTGEVGLACAFYGDVFRPPGQPLAVGDPWYEASDVEAGFEAELLAAWWAEAARVDAAVIAPDAEVLAGVPRAVQRALDALSGSRFFAGLAERALIFDLKQVCRYFHEPDVRRTALQRVAEVVMSDTRVLVGHSLGSVVAYEALCAHPEWPVRALVTLGSPLGIRNLIFDRLAPAPAQDPVTGALRGAWPGSVACWTNVADQGDVVALVKDLRPRFGERLVGFLVDNGASAHDVRPYLTAMETGRAVAFGLAD